MKKVLERYLETGREIQIHVRDKMVEGKVHHIGNQIVHMLGEKYEYFIPLDQILFVGSKLEPEKQKPKTVGF